ncbi:hypothetical protein KXV85_005978, partial [Aspergillus fumigatus]
RPPRLPCHGDGDRNHGLGELRAPHPRRFELGGGAARRARIRAGPDHRCGARPQRRVRLRCGRPSGRRSGRFCAQAGDHDLAAGRRLCTARSLRLRQDHAAQRQLRHHHAVAGENPVRRGRYHTVVNPEAQHRPGVP